MRQHTRAGLGAPYRQITVQWPGLKAVYAWLPPHDAVGVAQPNQIEFVFTAHPRADFELRRQARQIDVVPGTASIVGADPITWSRITEDNESLGLYPDLELLQRLAQPSNARRVEFATAVQCHDPVLLGVASAVRRACVAAQPLCDLERSTLAQLVARRVLITYCGIPLPDSALRGSLLDERAIRTVCEYVEANLCSQITLDDLAALVHLSSFHFARCFKHTLGLAPYQYVIARRMELAKRLLLTTKLPVAEIAWSLGYENISHFRRVFALQTGIKLGDVRRSAGVAHPAGAQESTFPDGARTVH